MTPFPAWYSLLGGYVHGVVPVAAIVFLAAFAAVHFTMNYTSFGRAVYAVGGNAEAARLSGINVVAVRMAVLAITSMLAAVSGILVSARFEAADPTVAKGWELDVIAAVIIGGTSLTGGVGTIWGTFVGVIFIGVILNGMTLLNVPTDWPVHRAGSDHPGGRVGQSVATAERGSLTPQANRIIRSNPKSLS